MIVALVMMSGASAGLATVAGASGQTAVDQRATLASSHPGGCNWVGQVMLVGFGFAPAYATLPAAGQMLQIANHPSLFNLLGDKFGGQPNGSTFGLPDLRGKAPPGLHYVICTTGSYPAGGSGGNGYGANTCNFRGQVVLVSFDAGFQGTVGARGQLLPAATNQNLFAWVGHTFGGKPGSGMFGAPDLRGQAPTGLHYRFCTSGAPPVYSPRSAWCNWLGQIVLSSFSASLRGTLPARGQILPVGQNEALYSLLGNTFGGNATMSTFALPNLRGKLPPGLHYLVCSSAGAYPERP